MENAEENTNQKLTNESSEKSLNKDMICLVNELNENCKRIRPYLLEIVESTKKMRAEITKREIFMDGIMNIIGEDVNISSATATLNPIYNSADVATTTTTTFDDDDDHQKKETNNFKNIPDEIAEEEKNGENEN